ncbi:MAG: pdc [Rickettsiaceae bacterium]|jgi:indolepyruvate decarboxylase|nr:pdc [Rickettsiaceae bacterium]
MPSKKQKIGEFLFDYLYSQGIDTAFGIPGDFVLPTFRYLDQSKIEIVTMTHEPSVGFAADCYARYTGLGLAIVTYCVGGLNMLNSIACAYAERSPVIVISGGPSQKDKSYDSMVHHKVRNFDTQRRVFEEVTCATTILSDPETAASEIIRIVEEVKRQSLPGYIEIPFDIVDKVIEVPSSLLKKTAPRESDKEALNACIKEITDRINNSKRPVIIAGVELHRFRVTDLAAQFAKEYNIPIAGTLLSKSVVRETNPLYIGVYSGAISEPACQEYIENSDCIILMGAFISDVLLGFYSAKLSRENTIVISKDKMQVGLHSYEYVEFKDVLQGLVKAKIKHRSEFVNPNPVTLHKSLERTERKQKLDVESLFRILSTHLQENDTVVCDTGDALIGAIGLRSSERSRFFSDAYYLSMGFAAPAAIGAMKANPKSKVFAIIGDGAFQMTGIEISTAAKYKLAPVVIMINNDGYGTQRHILDGDFNNINMWDYTKVTTLINYGKSVKVKTKGELDKALKAARKHKELYFIEVIVPRDNCSSSLRRMGEALGKLRNPDKRKK